MNQKKCPKCGEMNPAEAVMCWACFAPLSGAAAAAGAAAAGPPGAGGAAPLAAGEKQKFKFELWHGGAGLGLLVVLFFAFHMMTGSSSSSGGDDDPGMAAKSGGTAGKPASTGTAPVSSSAPTSPGPSGDSAPAPQPIPFTIVVSPNPRLSFGTMAIVPRQATAGGLQAASMAVFARNQLINPKRWATLHIYVFSDSQSAQVFADYQAQHQGQPLEDNDYNRLSSLWGSALVCYQYSGNRARVVYPQRDPSNWWRRSGRDSA